MSELIISDPICPQCGYALTGLPDDHACPECGFQYQYAALRQLVRHEYWNRLTRSQDLVLYSWMAVAMVLPLLNVSTSNGTSTNPIVAFLVLGRGLFLLFDLVTGMQPALRELVLPACMAIGLAFTGFGAPDLTILVLFVVWGFCVAVFLGRQTRLPYLVSAIPPADTRYLMWWEIAARVSMAAGTLALPLAVFLLLAR